LKLSTVRRKAFPLFGKVIDVDWKGDSSLLPLITGFSNDAVVDKVVKELGNLQVRTHLGRFQGFTVEVDRKFRPTNRHWEAIQKIAEYLSASTL
jgi:heat shock protein HspQ